MPDTARIRRSVIGAVLMLTEASPAVPSSQRDALRPSDVTSLCPISAVFNTPALGIELTLCVALTQTACRRPDSFAALCRLVKPSAVRLEPDVVPRRDER